MSRRWETLAARARGLATRLLDEETLTRLERLEDRRAFARILADSPYSALLPRGVDDDAVDVAVARHAALQIATLERWAGPDESLLAPILLPLDARAIRAVARGLRAGVPPDERIPDAVPTSSLGRKELELVGRTESVSELMGLLAAWDHPLAAPIRRSPPLRRRGPDRDAAPGREAAAAEPGLFAFEAALGRGLGAAMAEAARGGDDPVRSFVRHEIDSWNVATAFVLSGNDTDVDPVDLFVEGGSALSLDDFTRAVGSDGPGACASILAAGLRGTLFAEAVEGAPARLAAVDDRILDARIRGLRVQGRLRPLSAAPVLSFVLRLRREGRTLRRALWRTALSEVGAA